MTIPLRYPIALALAFIAAITSRAIDPLQPGVRGLATRAPKEMKIDGDLSKFKDAFCTPIEYFNSDLKNRAAQFFYMWDDEAFYAGLRTLDTKPANMAPDDKLWEGDAVEWYFDTRRDENFRGPKWGPGAVHCYWTGLSKTNVESRFCLRPGYLDAIKKIGVEVGAKRTAHGMDVEFKLPWANFPDFKAGLNAVIAVDAELCYSDGGPRVYRSFAYGSPLGVQQPASLGKIQLVERMENAFWKDCAPVLAPIRCDTEWTQNGKPQVTGLMALPPNFADAIGKIIFRVTDSNNQVLGDFPGTIETFQPDGNFKRARAQWSNELAPPGTYHLTGILFSKTGEELGRVAPRMVSVNMAPGY